MGVRRPVARSRAIPRRRCRSRPCRRCGHRRSWRPPQRLRRAVAETCTYPRRVPGQTDRALSSSLCDPRPASAGRSPDRVSTPGRLCRGVVRPAQPRYRGRPRCVSKASVGARINLPMSSSRADSAATYATVGSELRLSIPPAQGLWCPEDHDPLRVSGVSPGFFRGARQHNRAAAVSRWPGGARVPAGPLGLDAGIRAARGTGRGWISAPFDGIGVDDWTGR